MRRRGALPPHANVGASRLDRHGDLEGAAKGDGGRPVRPEELAVDDVRPEPFRCQFPKRAPGRTRDKIRIDPPADRRDDRKGWMKDVDVPHFPIGNASLRRVGAKGQDEPRHRRHDLYRHLRPRRQPQRLPLYEAAEMRSHRVRVEC